MSSTAKPQKDKAHGSSPRLMPRATAASTARAARNACNRNLTPVLRLSPSRTSSVIQGQPKGRCQPPPRVPQKSDSKSDNSDMKIQRCLDMQLKTDQIDFEKSQPEPVNITVVVTEMGPTDNNLEHTAEQRDSAVLQEINENDIFEIKHDSEDVVERQDVTESQSECRVVEEISSAKQTPRSRPTTPKSSASSRPQTPQALKSRPTTPRCNSRPTTPANPRFTSPSSRPSTPQTIPTRPTTPRSQAPPSPSRPKASCPPSPRSLIEEDVRTAFTLKRKQFNRMKKELDLKQQETLEIFDTLRAMRDRMCREGLSGCGEGLLQELVVFNVGDWTAEELAQLCRDAAASSLEGAVDLLNTTLPIDECALEELDSKVTSIPRRFADLCLLAFTSRQELIDFVRENVDNVLREGLGSAGGGECLERIAQYNNQGLELCEALRELKSRAEDNINTVTQLSRRACRERNVLLAVGESLVREIARLRQDIEKRITSMVEINEIEAETDVSKQLEETRRELEEERAASASGKDKLTIAESQLRQSRIRITKMDRQLREAELSITGLTATVKALEDQSRQKEVQMEARARKLKESLRTGEMTTGHLSQQRDTLQAEIAELKEQITTLTIQHKSAIQELTNNIKESRAELDTQQKNHQKEVELRQSAELAIVESARLIDEMKEKIQEMENNKPNPDLPTEREMDLWAELQATKDTLRLTEDEVTFCKREKVRFLETLTKIAETDNKVGMQQKLAGELLNKEEIVGKMQIQIRELTKNIKLNEQKVIQYEQYVRDLQAHNRAVANCQETPNGISYEDLQQEVMNLKMTLLESVHRNDELSELLVQKDQQIEQQDKTSRAQARVIKVREELINMLKNKETEQSRELTALQQDLEHRMKIVDGVNKQIATKADEIQELFGTLENKQQQIHRLEKIVLALEEQQRRAQAQRIRHEEKIAALEHELAAEGNRRERKFLFF